MKIFILFQRVILILCVFSCLGQEEDDFLIKSRQNSNKVFDFVKQKENNKPYARILLSISDSLYIVVSDKNSSYTERIIEFKNSSNKIKLCSKKTIEKPNELLHDGFKWDNYQQEFISFNSEFYKDGYEVATGSKTYFVMVDENNNKRGEAILSVIVKPNPIDSKLYGLLTSRLVNFQKCSEEM